MCVSLVTHPQFCNTNSYSLVMNDRKGIHNTAKYDVMLLPFLYGFRHLRFAVSMVDVKNTEIKDTSVSTELLPRYLFQLLVSSVFCTAVARGGKSESLLQISR